MIRWRQRGAIPMIWRPRLPRPDPDFWTVATILFIAPVLFMIAQGEPVVPALLVGAAFVGILYMVRR